MKHFNNFFVLLLSATLLLFTACEKDDDTENNTGPLDPDTAEKVSVDRFSEAAGTLHLRSLNPDLPDPNEPINFDNLFLAQGLGPGGQVVKYYDFDVMPLKSAPIYVLFREGESDPVEGQLNIINVIPGDIGYSDFWQMYKVTVPADYVANSATSLIQILDNGYTLTETDYLINCPVAPEGSTAELRYTDESNTLERGWYKNKVVYYFTFEEKVLTSNANGYTPISPIYVTFNINPDINNANSGPASGFVTETGSAQTHNVLATIPTDDDYSPLWSVYVYDNADFDNVTNLATAQAANVLAQNVMYVNCPEVSVGY
jgi:hypothetical protein